MVDKKTKLSLSGIAKKSIENIELAKTQSKNSVIIEKKPNRFSRNSFNKQPVKRTGNVNSGPKGSSTFPPRNPSTTKTPSISNDYEKRKLAEQRATRRIKGEAAQKDLIGKIGQKKRDVKLGV